MKTKKILEPSERLVSLDFMRGLIMVLLMIESTDFYFRLRNVVPSGSFGAEVIGQFFHNHWTGLNFWDLIQPAFMFMAGVSMAYSMKKLKEKGILWNQRFSKIMKRSGWLVFWGVLKRVYAPNWLVLESIDVTDILTQLAFASVIAFLISDWKIKNQLIMIVGILLFTEFIYRFWNIPNWVEGYSDGKNIGSYIDWILLGQKSNHYVFINWLPTSVHTIAGVIAGKLLIQKVRPMLKLTVSAVVLLLLGYGLDWCNITPIIKPIATSSFVIASLGYCLLILVVLYWWIDVKNHKRNLLFFQVVGMNSIFIYLFCDIVGRYWLNHYAEILLSPIEQILSLSHSYFLLIASVGVFALEWYLCVFLYRNKIFFKL